MTRSGVSVPLLSLALVATLLAAVPTAQADDSDPGISPSFAFFPTHDEVASSLDDHADHPWVTLHTLGVSGEGRTIRLAEVTDPDSPVPMEDRVVTFIFTQQHGNEPAGTPAALKLLDDITSGKDIAKTLSNQILLLLPMVNPDGATANQRGNADSVDINRDHITLETPEANLVHQVLNQWDVHVAMDHHEYGGTGLGNPSPVRLYDYDLTTLFPVHGNVRDTVDIAARDLMYEGIWPRAEADGYTANEYGEQTVAGIPIEYVAGGPDPGIMRNHLGLHHVAGLLVETRVDAHPNPFHDALRRTAIHSSVMEATLEYVAANNVTFIAAKASALADDHEHPWKEYDEGATTSMAAAYKVPTDADTATLFAAHALHPGHAVGDAHVHNIAGEPYAGHAAAIVHPDSSRAVVAGEPTEAVVAAAEAAPEQFADSPGPALLGVLAVALLALLVRRRE